MANKKVIIGSRGSDLALWQAHFLQDKLSEKGHESEVKIIRTKGDNIQNIGFSKMEGKGFFTKEIEYELANGMVDMAVHSMKDLPTTHPEGLVVAGTSYREDPSDTLLILKEHVDPSRPLQLKENTVVGTSSSRRKAMLKDIIPSVKIEDIRGNVPTRVEKLRKGDFGAIVLATAGIVRLKLDLSDLHIIKLHPREFIPAPAQGVLAYQTRTDDIEMRKIVGSISHNEVARITNIERKVLNMMDGGCQLPLGVYAEQDANGFYHVYAALASMENDKLVRYNISQSTTASLAENIYEHLTNLIKA